MKAIYITHPGDASVLKPVDVPLPVLKPGELLIRTVAAGINRPDILQRLGKYPPPDGASEIPGLEVAGFIETVGDGVGEWKTGDAVCALAAGGGYAEYVAVPAGQCLPVPEGLGLVEAAALPETIFTVWSNVVMAGKLASGGSILIHGGSSGIGTIAIQLAKAIGARVLCTVGSPEKAQFCRGIGADTAIDYNVEDFTAVVEATMGGQGVGMVLDMVGGDYVPRNLRCLGMDGRHISIAMQRGAATMIDLALIMQRRLVLTGAGLRGRPIAEKAAIAASLRQDAWPLIKAGRVKPVIDRTFPLDRAADAHRLMETGTHMGKIVLTL